MAAYAGQEDFQLYGYQSSQIDPSLIDSILLHASRVFDRVAEVPDDYFAETNGVAYGKTFYGNASGILELDPHVGEITDLTLPDGYELPAYIERNGNIYITRQPLSPWPSDRYYNFYYGWPENVAVTVTAIWGFEAVPDDVVEAVLELATAIYRGKDSAFAKVIQLETSNVINSALPERTKLVAEKWKAKREVVFA
jgi:hypothetical protein